MNTLYIKSILLLFLLISANFINNTLSCGVQTLLTHNMYIKHVVILVTIYLTINFTDEYDEHPNNHIKKSLFIWLVLLAFNKMSVTFTLLTLFVIAVYVHMYSIYTYNEKNNNNNNVITYKYITRIRRVIMLLIAIGFASYFYKQYNDHYDDFSMVAFLLGKEECESN
jgi:hypothetical protein